MATTARCVAAPCSSERWGIGSRRYPRGRDPPRGMSGSSCAASRPRPTVCAVVEDVRMGASGDPEHAGPHTPPHAADPILDHLDLAVIVRAGDGAFVYANQAAAD